MKKTHYAVIIAAMLAIALPFVSDNAFLMSVLFTAAFYALVSTGWNVVGGFAGQLGIGNGLYVGLGLYFTLALFDTCHISPWFGMVLAGLITGTISLFLGFATFPLTGSYYSLATIALLNILRIIFNQNERMFGLFFGGANGLRMTWIGGMAAMQFVAKSSYYFIILALLAVALLWSYYISRSKWGYYLRAISTNQDAASSLGVNVLRYKLQAQFVTAFVMAVGGGVYGVYMMYMDPSTIFSFQLSFMYMVVAIFGGRGTVFGPTIGAIILMPGYELLRLNFGKRLPGLPMVLFGLLLMLCVQFMPNGIVDKVSQIARAGKEKRQLANRGAGDEE